MHELPMLPFFGRISDATWHFFSPVQWPKSGGWAENTWGYRLTSNSKTVLPIVKLGHQPGQNKEPLPLRSPWHCNQPSSLRHLAEYPSQSGTEGLRRSFNPCSTSGCNSPNRRTPLKDRQLAIRPNMLGINAPSRECTSPPTLTRVWDSTQTGAKQGEFLVHQ